MESQSSGAVSAKKIAPSGPPQAPPGAPYRMAACADNRSVAVTRSASSAARHSRRASTKEMYRRLVTVPPSHPSLESLRQHCANHRTATRTRLVGLPTSVYCTTLVCSRQARVHRPLSSPEYSARTIIYCQVIYLFRLIETAASVTVFGILYQEAGLDVRGHGRHCGRFLSVRRP